MAPCDARLVRTTGAPVEVHTVNILMLDEDPRECARSYPDRLVAAATRDAACLLSAAHVALDGVATAKARIGLLLPTYYAPVYTARAVTGSPWARWAQRQHANYRWLHRLLYRLTQEFYRRWHRTHPFELVASQHELFPLNLPMGGPVMLPAPQCMPVAYRRSNAVAAYRLYFVHTKRALAHWSTPAAAPAWYNELSQSEGLNDEHVAGKDCQPHA
jgi:hypothetical protein